MAKPTSLPSWATNTNYAAGPGIGTPTKVDPTSGRKADGWEISQKPPAQNQNWWQNLVYLWLLWLDGIFTTSGGLTSLTLDGDLTVGGSTDAELLTPYFSVAEVMPLDIHGSTYSSFGTTNSGDKQSTGAAQMHDVAICLPVGAVISEFHFRYFGGGANVTGKLVEIADAVETDLETTSTITTGGSWQPWTETVTSPVTVADGKRYVIRWTAAGSGVRIGAPAVTWTRPRP